MGFTLNFALLVSVGVAKMGNPRERSADALL